VAIEKSKQEAETRFKEPSREILELRQRWKWVERSIWTDKMLTALENGVKGGKWFSLIDKIVNEVNLYGAWERVSRNKGAAGIDKISIEKFNEKATFYLNEIKDQILSQTFTPNAVKRVYIPKGDGKTRPLGIPTVKDRVVQAAIKQAIEPIFEKEFLDMSYGFRPGRGAKDALRAVDNALKEGYTWVVDADIQGYFDNIPHDKLMKKVESKISDSKVLNLIESFLKANIMEEMNSWTPTQGTPQGGVLSPLLANIYLHDLDVLMTKKGFRMFRYADDFVILTQDESSAKQALEIIRTWVDEHGLTLHPEKTHLGNCALKGQGFEFLGYRFENGYRFVRKKSMKKLKGAIHDKTKRTCGMSLQMVIKRINPTLKGWFEYFKQAHKTTFADIDGHIRRRLRAILRAQEKRPGMGWTHDDHKKWPNKFFREVGLFSLEQAHAHFLSQSRCGNS